MSQEIVYSVFSLSICMGHAIVLIYFCQTAVVFQTNSFYLLFVSLYWVIQNMSDNKVFHFNVAVYLKQRLQNARVVAGKSDLFQMAPSWLFFLVPPNKIIALSFFTNFFLLN